MSFDYSSEKKYKAWFLGDNATHVVHHGSRNGKDQWGSLSSLSSLRLCLVEMIGKSSERGGKGKDHLFIYKGKKPYFCHIIAWNEGPEIGGYSVLAWNAWRKEMNVK